MQRLLNFYSWSADEVRDDLRAYVAAAIGDVGGVLIPDETGFLKKGTKSAAVARQARAGVLHLPRPGLHRAA